MGSAGVRLQTVEGSARSLPMPVIDARPPGWSRLQRIGGGGSRGRFVTFACYKRRRTQAASRPRALVPEQCRQTASDFFKTALGRSEKISLQVYWLGDPFLVQPSVKGGRVSGIHQEERAHSRSCPLGVTDACLSNGPWYFGINELQWRCSSSL